MRRAARLGFTTIDSGRNGEKKLFKPMFDWHQRHGFICGFDQQSPSRAGEPIGDREQYADYMATHRWYQAPGSDHHGDAKIQAP